MGHYCGSLLGCENTRNEEKANVGKVRNQSIERASFIGKVVEYDGEEEKTEHFKDKFKVKTDMAKKNYYP